MSQTKNIIGINWLKGLLITLMVVGHAGAPETLERIIYIFHMPCFFMISGFLFKAQHLCNSKQLIRRKIKGLWMPYVKWSLLFLSFEVAGVLMRNPHELILDKSIWATRLVHTLIMIRADNLLGGFWFIASLFIASLFAILYFKLVGYSKKTVVIGVLIGIVLTWLFMIFNIYQLHLNRRNSLAILYFMTGVLLRCPDVMNKMRRFVKWGYLVAILTAVFGKRYSISFGAEGVYTFIPCYIATSMICATLILTCVERSFSGFFNFFVPLGKRSLDILIFHFTAFKVVSLIKIIHYGLPLDAIREYPVIKANNDYYWIAYSVAGVVLSLMLMNMCNLVTNHLGKLKNFVMVRTRQLILR